MKNKRLFSLGDLHISDCVESDQVDARKIQDLTLFLEEETGAVRLESVVDPNLMYGKYWYRSGINATMTKELKGIVESCLDCITVEPEEVWLDIACNDGTLLKQVPPDIIKVGIDPVDDSYTCESKQVADLIIQDFFSADVYKKSKVGHKKAKVVTIIAMFYDLDDPLSCLREINDIMDDEGLLLIQMSYTPLMLRQLAFDNICHEHVYYYNLTSMKTLLEKAGMQVVDCQLNDINGGSFRLYVRKACADPTLFKTSPYRDVAQYRIDSVLTQEAADGMNKPEPYLEFFKEITSLKNETVDFIRKAKEENKTIWGYGASTKGNTLLQWFGLDERLIDAIAERNPLKYGLKTVGTNIPIKSEDEMRKANPDYVLVLPWHFINEFKNREKEYLNGGGKFIVPCPKFEII
tara:strand:+ start:2117 stop:3337 length:1221 start_codon:yes stop_codon:yes gene_type:complete